MNKYALKAEQQENLELWKLSNGLKCAAKENKSELNNILEKKKGPKEKKHCVALSFGFFI